ncbi:MAG TPA: HEAT repeat domain-containing protein [Terriglobia bacterium]|nr:HEAT repeat domain-containing protein [Terriglobia bacterium]
MKRATWLCLTFITFCAAVSAVSPVVFGGQAANPLVEELKSPNADIRAKAAQQLGQSADPSVEPALAAALNDPSTKVREQVIVALDRLHTVQSLHGLLAATKDSDPDVRTLAVRAVVGWYTGSIPELGFTGMIKHSYRSAMQSIQGTSTSVSPGTQVDPQVVAALEAAMGDTRSIQAAREAAQGLGTLLARPAVPALVKAAHSSDPDLAVNALNALSHIKDISVGPQLVDLLDSPSKEVRQTACITVGVLRTRAAVPKLQEIYQNDPDNDTRESALNGLAFIGDPASYAIFIKALEGDNKQDRMYGAEGLARARVAKARSALDKRMQIEKDSRVKLAIRFAQTSLGESQHLQDLVDALGSRTLGDSAQSYLIELARRKNILSAIYAYLHSGNANIRRRLCTVLMYSGDASSLSYLQPLTKDRNSDVAAEALRAEQAIRARTKTG